MVIYEQLMKMDESDRKAFLGHAFRERRLSRRPDMVMPPGARVLLAPMSDAAQRSTEYMGMEINFPPIDDGILIDFEPLRSAAVLHLGRVDVVFQADGTTVLGYVLYWRATVYPRTEATMARYRQRNANGESPYEMIKRLAVDISMRPSATPLWTGAFLAAFAHMETDGNEHTEVTWSATPGIALANERACEWNEQKGRPDWCRRLRNWWRKASFLGPDRERSIAHIDTLSPKEVQDIIDHWYDDELDGQPYDIHRMISDTLLQAALSLLHARAREPDAAQQLIGAGILPGRIPQTIMARQPIAQAKQRRGLVTILQIPSGPHVDIIDDED